ncbi:MULTISPECIES: F390 synthetase-related protein [unclassified Imperialibacter]|uniref:F390 synthetase-related protein n=1 Tax=unclassified Imperialibacter TaxID=2629706 RepID=UPI001254D7B4|nr:MULTISPECIES: F390 synthetase-related protein [unclassified Imperialibacter]CAD5273767.1 Adenylate cyclase [Imperialibacter sp. 75]CAD5274132.1 Adenylate cyclase [Imperialibacter sp. 89]VVT22655.1 Adenylate cyclase [Imperialibacter sp. EC-SDR9]
MIGFKLQILWHFLLFRWQRRKRYNQKSLHQLRATKENRWRKNLQKSPFYKAFSDQPLSQFPIMDKSSFMTHFDEINTVGITKEGAFAVGLESEKSRNFSPTVRGTTVGLSSGTSGNRGIFLASQKERAIWVAAVLDRVIGFSLRKRKVAFFLRANSTLYESVNSSLLQFQFYDIKSDMAQHCQTVAATRPHILVGQPSVLMHIARYFEEKQIAARFEKVISVAEVLEGDQKAYLEKVFKIMIEQVYQCTEGFLAHTCKAGFLHFNEDWLLIEKKYLDEEKKRFHPIITDLLRTTQPIVRYELNDIIHEGKPCSCGLKTMQIAKIEGRSDDVFEFVHDDKTITIYPDFIRQAVAFSSDVIDNYVVIRRSEKKIGLFIEVNKGDFLNAYGKAESALQSLFEIFGIPGITIIREEEQLLQKGVKFKRIRNESHQTV